MTLYLHKCPVLVNCNNETDKPSVLVLLLSNFNTVLAKVWENTKWLQLKYAWSQETGIPMKIFQLLYNGEELNNIDIVGKLVMKDKLIIEVKLNLNKNQEDQYARKSKYIYYDVFSPMKLFRIRTKINMEIVQLKEVCSKKQGIPTGFLKLFYKGEEIIPGITARTLGLEKEGKIDVRVKRKKRYEIMKKGQICIDLRGPARFRQRVKVKGTKLYKLKRLYSRKRNVPMAFLKLIYRNREIHDYDNAEQLGIRNKDTIEIREHPDVKRRLLNCGCTRNV